MKHLLLLLFVYVVVTTVSALDFFSKDCCEPHDDEHLGRICDDGSRAPFVGCCGRGSCNVMCCNCDDGCLTGNHKPYKLLGVWGADISPNLGFSGASKPVAAAEFGKELAKNAGLGVTKAAVGIGSKAASNKKTEDSDIEYIPGH